MRISFTLSRYIFADLLRIFLMASGALAGIMSFGGLLRPLTQQGLDASQVGKLLTYFTPAMTAYSFPIAALFATTVVYGRLSADNELTACRAAGLSLLSVAMPAFVLGLVVALVSFLFLSFVVPAFTLKAEEVVYSNIAKLIAGRIERSHQIPLTTYTVFAQEAYLPPFESLRSREQQVVLVGPTIVRFKQPMGKEDPSYRVPEEFWTASSATAYITQTDDTANPQLTVALRDGMTFPRNLAGAMTGAVGATQFGPVPIQSPIKENSKFMDLRQLRHLYAHREDSRKIQDNLSTFIQHDEQFGYLRAVENELDGTHRYLFQAAGGEEYLLSFGEDVTAAMQGEDLVVGAPPAAGPAGAASTRSAPRANALAPDAEKRLRVQRRVNGRVDGEWRAAEVRLQAHPRRATEQVDVSMKLMGVIMTSAAGVTDVAAGAGAVQNEGGRAVLPIGFRVAMPQRILDLARRPLEYYLSPAAAGSGNQPRLKHELTKVTNDIVSESHSRAAFAVSCLILVMVGCALGMMFRSGNFLTAFAVSFVPALMGITLIIAGQQTCGNVPWTLPPNAIEPLKVGVFVIWSGNIVNFVIATALLWRLWRI